ncbi:hypothetical protein BHE74_00042851 [Ensete ventricosum]|nr:hypothetical protein GW17_00033359 [Ensete ventricosum]RWW50862.1 hypothetical protein BHE74_00042851 [Ensete ventricosum]
MLIIACCFSHLFSKDLVLWESSKSLDASERVQMEPFRDFKLWSLGPPAAHLLPRIALPLAAILIKIHGDGESSSSDSDDEKSKGSVVVEAVKSKIYRLLGREKPVHQILGGGKRTISLFRLFYAFNVFVSCFDLGSLDSRYQFECDLG